MHDEGLNDPELLLLAKLSAHYEADPATLNVEINKTLPNGGTIDLVVYREDRIVVYAVRCGCTDRLITGIGAVLNAWSQRPSPTTKMALNIAVEPWSCGHDALGALIRVCRDLKAVGVHIHSYYATEPTFG